MIIDCTMFHWEFDILELRMRELWDSVDYFVVTESICDHRGNKRELVLSENIDKFTWAKEKMIVNISDKLSTAETTWDHEKYQRLRSVNDAIEILGLSDKDFLIVSDVDEIPKSEAIKEMGQVGGRYTLHMPMYYYYLNLYVHDWFHPKAFSVKYLSDPNDIRTGGHDKDFHVAYNSGWHFSYLGSPEQIQHKLKTFAHEEFDSEMYTNLDLISNRIKNKSDLFDRFDGNFTVVELEKMPSYVKNNYQKYKKLILEE